MSYKKFVPVREYTSEQAKERMRELYAEYRASGGEESPDLMLWCAPEEANELHDNFYPGWSYQPNGGDTEKERFFSFTVFKSFTIRGQQLSDIEPCELWPNGLSVTDQFVKILKLDRERTVG